MHQEVLPGISQLETEDEGGLDSDVINPLALQEVCQRWESVQSFPEDGMDLTEGGNPLL